MARVWSRPAGVTDPMGGDYWDYFAAKLIERANIQPGKVVLDIGCGTGTSLFPAAEKTSVQGYAVGYAVGIDICPG